MKKSTRKQAANKPGKPYEGFPLFVHQSGGGRWAKKVGGRHVFFGSVRADPDGKAALDEWLRVRDDLLAGRTPRPKAGSLTVVQLCDRYMNSRRRALDAGEIVPRTFHTVHRTCWGMVHFFGRDRPVDDLAADDFEQFRSHLAKSLGPVTLGVEIGRVRSVFKYGFDQGLLDKPVRYGQSFRKPPRKVVQQARNARGSRMLEAAEIRKLLDVAPAPWPAMILLGINGGLGPHDIARLPFSALQGDWLVYPRPKTAVPRRIPIWGETRDAIEDAMNARPAPADEADAELAFLTARGNPWGRGTQNNMITHGFRLLLQKHGLHRHGVGFYALRRSFETVAGASRDQPAVDHVMGHSDPSMAAAYRERIDDDRLLAVTNYVRRWLWPADAGEGDQAPETLPFPRGA